MQRLRALLTYFTPFEWGLWLLSLSVILGGSLAFGGDGAFSVIASLIGVTALIFCAKGNPLGQALCVVFGVLYAIISYAVAYYGEMVTYAGMTVPMAALSLWAWLKNPYGGKRSEVRVAALTRWDALLAPTLTLLVTVVFYFVLRALGTANLLPSTVSVATSFLAVYLTFRRSPWFALAYAANDLVLIVLWVLATLGDPSYLSVVMCFAAFFLNDVYAFFNWRRLRKKQGQ
ncbi:MAG: nicotinamide mononucleotide transporter [Clostridia bacterium]|nr:nicotinamide mononucleotide transporter [Clostridia bacterium]